MNVWYNGPVKERKKEGQIREKIIRKLIPGCECLVQWSSHRSNRVLLFCHVWHARRACTGFLHDDDVDNYDDDDDDDDDVDNDGEDDCGHILNRLLLLWLSILSISTPKHFEV